MKEIKQIQKIFISEKDIPKTKTRKALLREILRKPGTVTYSDKECTIVQCSKTGEDVNKKISYRSITDLYFIIKTRFEITSWEGFLKILHEFMIEDKTVIMMWCNMISKVVLKHSDNKALKYITKYSEQNYYEKKGVDGYSLKDYNMFFESLTG